MVVDTMGLCFRAAGAAVHHVGVDFVADVDVDVLDAHVDVEVDGVLTVVCFVALVSVMLSLMVLLLLFFVLIVLAMLSLLLVWLVMLLPLGC